MSDLASGGANKSYLNPVYPKSFPDPFVLKYNGKYFGYSTGFAGDGNVFEVITSDDLVTWTALGGAMTPLETSPPFYWAPEITYSNGKFYLYYSVGNETLMEIRVAVSDEPHRGFVDSGRRLTREDFAIDAHVFIDDDGSKYLFYATDFLEHSHIGTGTAVDRMIDWFTLAGEPRAVTRAKYDWQVYDPHRKEKGGVRWHTVEGPTILKRKGKYYEMFSGGNWQNTTYGVSFAASDTIDTLGEWEQFCDGDEVLPILRTEPEIIVGPGHNSVVRGPNNRELYCVYHRWTEAGRVLAIDRMDFAGQRIFVVGATHTPQPMPFSPSGKGGDGGAELRDLPTSFLCEIAFRLDEIAGEDKAARVRLTREIESLDLILDSTSNEVRCNAAIHELGKEFDWSSPHIIRIEVDYCRINIRLDDSKLPTQFLSSPITASENAGLEILSLELTEGFEELFEDALPLESNGWILTGDASHRVDKGELFIDAATEFEMSKHRPLQRLEFAANFRSVGKREGEFGLVLRSAEKDELRFAIDLASASISLHQDLYEFPFAGNLDHYHQLRIIRSGAEALCYIDDTFIKKLDVADVSMTASIYCKRVSAAIEMIRLTAI